MDVPASPAARAHDDAPMDPNKRNEAWMFTRAARGLAAPVSVGAQVKALALTIWPPTVLDGRELTILEMVEEGRKAVADVVQQVGERLEYAAVAFESPTGEALGVHGHVVMRFRAKMRPASVVGFLPSSTFIESCKDFDAFIVYMKKAETALLDGEGEKLFFEWGVAPAPARRGQRTDIERYADAVRDYIAMHGREAQWGDFYRSHMADFPGVLVQYTGGAQQLFLMALPKVEEPKIEFSSLRPWQRDMFHRLSEKPNGRSVIFVLDQTGGAGKSYFCRFMLGECPNSTVVLKAGLDSGKDAGMLIHEGLRCLFIDVGRANGLDKALMKMLCGLAESVLDGSVVRAKYHTNTCRLAPVHVVFFVNDMPDGVETLLSVDRIKVVEVAAPKKLMIKMPTVVEDEFGEIVEPPAKKFRKATPPAFTAATVECDHDKMECAECRK